MTKAAPRLILLPGLDGTDVLFEPLRRHLTLASEAVSYEGEGRGTYAALKPLVRERLPTEGPFVLVGWSFSGPLALAVAAERPPGLRGVVLVASFVTKPAPLVPRCARVLARPLLFRFTPLFARTKALFGGYRTPEMDDLLRRAHGRVPPAILAERVRATLTVDARDELRACQVPVLYLAASRDLVVPPRNLRQIRALRDDVEVRTVPGPHLALATNPAAAAAAIEAFVAGLDRAVVDDVPAADRAGLP